MPPAFVRVSYREQGQTKASTVVAFDTYDNAKDYAIQYSKDRAERSLSVSTTFTAHGLKLAYDDGIWVEVLSEIPS
jgi:surface antigen